MIINVGDSGGGVIVWNKNEHDNTEPVGDETIIWVDTTSGYPIPKYWNGQEWKPVASVWS